MSIQTTSDALSDSQQSKLNSLLKMAEGATREDPLALDEQSRNEVREIRKTIEDQ